MTNTIEKELARNSSNCEEFKKATSIHKKPLIFSGYNEKLKLHIQD